MNESNNRFERKAKREKEARDMMSMYDPAINSWREPHSNVKTRQHTNQNSKSDLRKQKIQIPNVRNNLHHTQNINTVQTTPKGNLSTLS